MSYFAVKRVLSTREIYQQLTWTFTVDGLGLVLMNFNDEQNIGNLNNDLYYILKMIMNQMTVQYQIEIPNVVLPRVTINCWNL